MNQSKRITVISGRFLCLLLMMLPLLLAARPPRAQVNAEINYSALPPGQEAVVAVTLDVPPGLHVQAHDAPKPFIASTLTVAEVPQLEFLNAQYPPAALVEYPALGKLRVYTGKVTMYLPLRVSRQAAVGGEIEVAGEVRYQACDERTCYAPERVPFAAKAKVVQAGEAVASTSTTFAAFDPRVFAGSGQSGGMSSGQGVSIQFFGWSFMLAHSAYFVALAVAFVVGILFNLMPCVLPVLPLKAIGFYEVSRHNRSRSLLLGGVFSIGLLAAFAVLAVLVVVYQAAWGSQFSKPWFVWTMVGILTLFALGMFGAFTVLLPSRVYAFAPSHETIGGNFLFGAFTALLSTPCTAPMFVGLLAWAGAQPRWLGVAAVLMVGVGMAFPYFALSALPELARRLPRSGPWSELIKQCMAFLILAVAVYFAAGQLVHSTHFIWAVFAVVALGCVYLVVRAVMLSPRPRPRLIALLVAIAVGGGSYAFARNLTAGEVIAWQPYSAQRYDAAVASGQVTMLEFTANWCTNCLELEGRVLRDAKVGAEIERLRVIPLRADLSQDNAAGWPKLREITPSGGIPLTVITSPKLKEPIYLSSVYTTDQLLRALRQAAGE